MYIKPWIAIAALAIVNTAVARADPTPNLSKCSLELDGKTLASVESWPDWKFEHSAADQRFIVEGGKVRCVGASHDKDVWSVSADAGIDLQWLDSHGDIAYFSGYTKVNGTADPETPAVIRRLDLKKKQWLSPITVSTEKQDENSRQLVASVLADDKRVVALAMQLVKTNLSWTLKSYSVSQFAPGQEKPQWSQTYPANGGRPAPGAMLLSNFGPDQIHPAPSKLNWLGDGVLVCADEREDLISLTATGKEAWRIERLWELHRDFIGPSVWQHTIDRLDMGPFDVAAQNDKDRVKTLVDQRAKFDASYECAIVGGPVVAPAASWDGTSSAHIFVAVAKASAGNWSRYLSDCLVYELSGDGRVQAITSLPRMVNGGDFTVANGNVIWACQQGQIASLSPLREAMNIGPGGSDLIGDVAWIRTIQQNVVDAALSADPARDCIAYGKTMAIRTVQGGYRKDMNEKVYRFPLAVVDLQTGLARTATLVVPFDGDLPVPKTNYSTDAKGRITTRGPYLLGVTYLTLNGNQLDITIATEQSPSGLKFDISNWQPK